MTLKPPSYYQLGQVIVLAGLLGSSSFFSLGAIVVTVAIGLLETVMFIAAGLQLMAYHHGIEADREMKTSLYNIFNDDLSYWITVSMGVAITALAIYYQWIFTAFVWGYIVLFDEVYRRVVHRTISPPKGHPHGVETPR